MTLGVPAFAQYADLLLDVGLGFRAGKTLAINAEPHHAPLVHALCDGAYARGAQFVDVWYFDPRTKLSRVSYADRDTLGYVPEWLEQRFRTLSRYRGALINVVGSDDPHLFATVDGDRAGLDRMPALTARYETQTLGLAEWTFAFFPTDAWAEQILAERDAMKLWEVFQHLLRLDEPDPTEAWRRRIDELDLRCRQLMELRLESLRFQGDGTDLAIPLLPGGRWATAALRSADGIDHVAVLPTEEIFTAPASEGVEGIVYSTRPLVLGGSVVENLSLRLVRGRIVEVAADANAEVVRADIALDENAARLGEVALVDRTSRIRQTGLTFFNTGLDESAVSHLAWGSGIPDCHPRFDRARPGMRARLKLNPSRTHVDFMVGGPGVTVTGVDRAGREHLIIAAETWQL